METYGNKNQKILHIEIEERKAHKFESNVQNKRKKKSKDEASEREEIYLLSRVNGRALKAYLQH
jgi:hypothetical protein